MKLSIVAAIVISGLTLTACYTPVSEERLRLSNFVLTQDGWQAPGWTGEGASAPDLREGATYVSVEDIVGAAKLYGNDLDVDVQQKFKTLTVTMTATGYEGPTAGEKIIVTAKREKAADRITDIDRLYLCNNNPTGWIATTCR